MTNEIYLACFGVAVIGWLIHTITEMNSVRKISLKANLEFSYGAYFKMEVWSVVVDFLAIGMSMFFVKYIVEKTKEEWIALVFLGLSGWAGSKFVTGILGVARKRVDAAIDHKTTIADTATGTLDNPTPIAAPKETKP